MKVSSVRIPEARQRDVMLQPGSSIVFHGVHAHDETTTACINKIDKSSGSCHDVICGLSATRVRSCHLRRGLSISPGCHLLRRSMLGHTGSEVRWTLEGAPKGKSVKSLDKERIQPASKSRHSRECQEIQLPNRSMNLVYNSGGRFTQNNRGPAMSTHASSLVDSWLMKFGQVAVSFPPKSLRRILSPSLSLTPMLPGRRCR